MAFIKAFKRLNKEFLAIAQAQNWTDGATAVIAIKAGEKRFTSTLAMPARSSKLYEKPVYAQRWTALKGPPTSDHNASCHITEDPAIQAPSLLAY